MIVCKHCLEEMDSRDIKQRIVIGINAIPDDAIHCGFYDEDGEYHEDPDWEDDRSEDCVECELCGDMTLLDDAVVVE